MKVALINHSDTLGGASIVTFRLMQALRQQGVDARMLVLSKSSNNDSVEQVCSRWRRNYAFLSERLDIFLCNGFSKANLFSLNSSASWTSCSKNILTLREQLKRR